MSLLLRIILTSKKLTAQVTNPSTNTIIAMAASNEPDIVAKYRAKLNRVPRAHQIIDSQTSSQVGEKLGLRLRDFGVEEVKIDVEEEILRPFCHQRVVKPVFDSVEAAGVTVVGVEKLKKEFV